MGKGKGHTLYIHMCAREGKRSRKGDKKRKRGKDRDEKAQRKGQRREKRKIKGI